eukprot:CAMPEP_0196581346 /NCGR_PEP_ID=MMETSP1081-20130531/33732_1 /TAXON_ID=36882 /ORGANISM="Pyramimonas amylifera, Strain CCMP720" /LENGTH=212 /DNA_ID=CAMNT_0041901547 /DNA_START=73 /DNA_END=708 /DNA_ORIENTATION=+
MPPANTPNSASAQRSGEGFMATQATLAECCELMDEMTSIYSCTEDIEHLHSTEQLFREFTELANAKQLHVKEAIQGWTRRVSAANARSQAPEPLEAHAHRVLSLEAATEQAKCHVEALQLEIEELAGLRARLALEGSKSQDQQDTLELLEMKDIPDARFELSLYAHISKIHWHYEDLYRVKGHVSNTDQGTVVPFNLDPKQLSEFDLVNQMW